MSRPDAMSRRTIKYLTTKEARREERRQIGRLEDKRVSQTTLTRYQEAFGDLVNFARAPRQALLQDGGQLNLVLKNYIEHLWEDGDTRTMASYALAAAQYFAPQHKRQISEAWRLVSLWSRLEQPIRATPLSPEMRLAFAGLFLQWRWERLAYLTVVGFCGFLRTGEMFKLRRQHVVLPARQGQAVIIFLEDTKTS